MALETAEYSTPAFQGTVPFKLSRRPGSDQSSMSSRVHHTKAAQLVETLT